MSFAIVLKTFVLTRERIVSGSEVMELLLELSNGKAIPCCMEGNYILSVLLPICFLCMFKHNYLPVT